MSTATMTSKGQITIPKDVRDALGIEPGTKIDFVRVGEREYRLRPKTGTVEGLFGIAKYDGAPVSVEQMNEGIRNAAAGITSE